MNFHYVIICTHLQAVYIIRKSSHYHKVLTVHYSAVESLSTETCKNHTVQGGVDQEFIMKQEKGKLPFSHVYITVHVYLCMAPILAQASMEAARRGEAGM